MFGNWYWSLPHCYWFLPLFENVMKRHSCSFLILPLPPMLSVATESQFYCVRNTRNYISLYFLSRNKYSTETCFHVQNLKHVSVSNFIHENMFLLNILYTLHIQEWKYIFVVVHGRIKYKTKTCFHIKSKTETCFDYRFCTRWYNRTMIMWEWHF